MVILLSEQGKNKNIGEMSINNHFYLSSGQVYTFTQNSDRQAPPAIQQAYDEQLSFLISEEITRQDEMEV
jgi:hypothetical protein